MHEHKVICETPTPDKQPTRILKWKYDAVKRAIIKSIAKGNKGLPFKQLPANVERHLRATEKSQLGSIGWYTTCVKLDLEVKGVIKRLPGVSPQVLVRK